MSTATLTSLAILKVNVDHGNDYLDYLRPFLLQVLFDNQFDPVDVTDVKYAVRDQFGLDVPEPCIQIVLRRITRNGYLKRDAGIYRITKKLRDPRLTQKKVQAERQINAVIYGLMQFSQTTSKPFQTFEDAVEAICGFLNRFDISCLRAHLRGTVIPDLAGGAPTDILLVSDYILHIQNTEPQQFEHFVILLQGHMLANALTCTDLANAPGSYKDVVFYLDTPLIIRILGYEDTTKKEAAVQLINLVTSLGGTFAVFTHTCDELRAVFRGAARHVHLPSSRRTIVYEARKRGVSRSDLILAAENVEQKLQEFSITIQNTPDYSHDFQIDESIFEQVLDDEISYYSPKAKENDINSVRSIYAIRGNHSARSIERAKAVFVTTNSAFAEAAYQYGEQFESTREVSSVITDFSLANVAWLKSPLDSINLPRLQLLAFSYAALQPPQELLDSYLNEIERLETQHIITEIDHQLLRSSPHAYSELMRLTLGEDDAFNSETAMQVLGRVTDEITKAETKKLITESTAHEDTRNELEAEIRQRAEMISNIYRRRQENAKLVARIISTIIATSLAIGLFLGQTTIDVPILPRLTLSMISAFVLLFTFFNLTFGANVHSLTHNMESKIRRYMLNRDSKNLGIRWETHGIEP